MLPVVVVDEVDREPISRPKADPCCKNMEIAEDWGGVELRGLNEYRWEQLLIAELKRMGKTEKDIFKDRKLAPWKARLAVQLRKITSAGNPWIASRLNMGHPSNISWCLSQTRKS